MEVDERIDFEITEPTAQWYLENAYEATDAEDVVASILADFRGTDTLFEITVFATAALGLLTLLSRPQGGELLTGKNIQSVAANLIAHEAASKPTRDLSDDAEKLHLDALESVESFSARHKIPRFSTPLTRLVATLVLPFAIMISFAHMLYGGSGPGDGFTAGVVSGLGVTLWFVVYGYFEARTRLSWLRPGRLIAAGLSLALGNAVLGMFISDGFLAIAKYEGDLPADLHATTTLIFEFAIYLTVFGGVTMIMNAIADPGIKEKIE